MNKRKVDELIPKAVESLKSTKISSEKEEISKTFRGQISTFGAAVTNGSLISAVAFFSEKGSSQTDRTKLLTAIQELIPEAKKENNLFEYVKNQGKEHEAEVKEKILNAAIALKLAMNLYKLV